MLKEKYKKKAYNYKNKLYFDYIEKEGSAGRVRSHCCLLKMLH